MAPRNLNPDHSLSESLRQHGESIARKELLIFELQSDVADLQAEVKRLEADLKFSQERRQQLLRETY